MAPQHELFVVKIKRQKPLCAYFVLPACPSYSTQQVWQAPDLTCYWHNYIPIETNDLPRLVRSHVTVTNLDLWHQHDQFAPSGEYIPGQTRFFNWLSWSHALQAWKLGGESWRWKKCSAVPNKCHHWLTDHNSFFHVVSSNVPSSVCFRMRCTHLHHVGYTWKRTQKHLHMTDNFTL